MTIQRINYNTHKANNTWAQGLHLNDQHINLTLKSKLIHNMTLNKQENDCICSYILLLI
jgi:hypothetical protein